MTHANKYLLLCRVSAEFDHFNHKMEIALSVKSFAFYHSSQSIFIQGKVLEINHYPDSEPIFQLVQKGTQQNFKFAGDCEKYFHLLSKETIAIESTKIEEGKTKTGAYQTTFIADKIIPINLLEIKRNADNTRNTN